MSSKRVKSKVTTVNKSVKNITYDNKKTKNKDVDDTVEDANTEEYDNESDSDVSSTNNKPVADLPPLTYVSDTAKERYEYKPVLRAEIVYRRPEHRITTEIMSKFEFTEVVSIRAKQIENGGMSFTDVGELTDPIEIAKKEIIDKKCPLSIVRMITDVIAEKWAVNELAIPYD